MLVWQPPVGARASNHYRGRAGRVYSAHQLRGGDAVGAILCRKFAPYVSGKDGVVDFGCGSGHMLAHLDAAWKAGIEVNPTASAAARELGIQTVEAAEELDAGCADLITSHHALEHARSPLTELEALRRLLRPQGRLVLRVPIDDWRTQRRARPDDRDHHLYTWTPRLLANLLREAGYRLTEVRVVNWGYPGRLTYVLAPRISPELFDAVARLTAVTLKRRELHAVALIR